MIGFTGPILCPAVLRLLPGHKQMSSRAAAPVAWHESSLPRSYNLRVTPEKKKPQVRGFKEEERCQRPSSFVMSDTPVEVQFTSAGCLNYPCRTPVARLVALRDTMVFAQLGVFRIGPRN